VTGVLQTYVSLSHPTALYALYYRQKCVERYHLLFFEVMLTVHLSLILLTDQLNAPILVI